MHSHSLAQYPAAVSFILLHHVPTTAHRQPFFSDLSFLSLLKRFLLNPQYVRQVKPFEKNHYFGTYSTLSNLAGF